MAKLHLTIQWTGNNNKLPTKVSIAGLDNVTSAICRHQQRLGLGI
jgi:hypothetical protein